MYAYEYVCPPPRDQYANGSLATICTISCIWTHYMYETDRGTEREREREYFGEKEEEDTKGCVWGGGNNYSSAHEDPAEEDDGEVSGLPLLVFCSHPTLSASVNSMDSRRAEEHATGDEAS